MLAAMLTLLYRLVTVLVLSASCSSISVSCYSFVVCVFSLCHTDQYAQSQFSIARSMLLLLPLLLYRSLLSQSSSICVHSTAEHIS
jgi:hypothetical protein